MAEGSIATSDLANELKRYAKDISIIYAEDEPSVSKQVEIFLRKFFTDIRVFNSGEKAYVAYLERTCDILITDLVMAQMNGIELLSLVRHIKKEQKIVAITAHNETEYMIKLINIEVDAFLQKPLNDRIFLETLYTLCKELHEEKEYNLKK